MYYEASIRLWNKYEDECREEEYEKLSNKVNNAINYNNLSVVELRSKNYPAALAAAKQALDQIE